MNASSRPVTASISVAVVALLALSGCSSASSPTAAAKAPAGGSSSIVIPQQTGAAPGSYVDAKNQLVGFMPDMSTALGKALGVAETNQATTFENSLLGLASGKYTTVPGADVTPARLKTMDFALMYQDAYTFQVPASSGKKIGSKMSDLCGLSIAVVASSSPIVALNAQSQACTAAGKQPLQVKTFPDYASANLAADSGQADASTSNVSSLEYQQKLTPGKAIITGPTYQKVNIGWAVPKGSKWGPKIVTAMNKIIADGTYREIFGKYGLPGLASLKQSRLVTK